MNMVNKSIEMKKPNTPVESKKNQRKNCFGSGSIFHEANTPARTMKAESRSITTDTPSTPRANSMLNGAYHITLLCKSISEVSPAARACKNITTRAIASAISTVAPVSATALIALMPLLLHKANPPNVRSGTITK